MAASSWAEAAPDRGVAVAGGSGGSIRERLAGLDRRELIGLLAVGALIAVGAVFWYVRSLPAPVRVEAGLGRAGSPAGASAPSVQPSPSPSALVVDVAGWVRHPGVYDFHQGDRVIDAIHRAGGARQGADLTSINLAALLTDAEQIVVVRGGPGSVSGAPAGGAPAGSGGQAPVNINTATLDQLETLPGIGPVLGQRIVDYRQQHGPFRSVEDLLNVSGIGDQRLADLRPMITV
jgi:competence protein ComEA